jgi:CspA family cold shock protein
MPNIINKRYVIGVHIVCISAKDVKGALMVISGREVGVVKWYDESEGYGYIARKGKDDLYVHYSSVLCHESDCAIHEGDSVSFTVVRGKHGLQAMDVMVIKHTYN